MADVKCCHCGDPIRRNDEPGVGQPWVHDKTGDTECPALFATPKSEMVITEGPPRERIVYVPVYRDGRGGMRRG